MSKKITEAQSPGPAVQEQDMLPPETPVAQPFDVPPSGRHAAFRDVRRQLTDDELSSPAVQRLLIGMLDEVDEEREGLGSYVGLYHEADKKAAVLTEKMATHHSIEIFFGVGIGLGGAIIGLAPFFWGVKPVYGIVTAIVGLGLVIGASAGRMVKK